MPMAKPPPPKLIKPETVDSATIWGKIRSSADLTVNVPVPLARPGWQSRPEHAEGQVSLPSHRHWLQQGKELKLQGSMTKLLSLPQCCSALRKGSIEKDSVLRSPASWRTDCRLHPSPGHGHSRWGFSWHCPDFSQNGWSHHPNEILKITPIRSMISPKRVGGQKPTLITLFTENINKWWSFL